ncbi:MAG TPA: LytTR family DNA-binding domain-containing protein [Cyclobacteriaceae bacterium]|jgi:DNA-binding LytR/AlgR family response regulator|nr:LytTR family DNA-binding domain-containing protein [Cyclobacteriaceae bacterium]
MKYKCLIIDDEAPAHKVLQAHISKTDLLEISGDVYDGKEALDFMRATKVDLIFLDIEMPKLTGLELLQCLPYPAAVILTTAYSNFGFEAYQNDVVDYLLKPISFPRFLKAINKVTTILGRRIEGIEFPEIELKHEGIVRLINTKNVIYIEAVGNYIKIHLENEKPLLVTQTMKYISSLLPPHHFTRIHKSFIVKREAIADMNKTEVTLTNKVVLPIGRKYSVLLE